MSERSAAQASPRSEDLTKIKFARFHFNGVNTTLLDRKTKNLNNSGGGDTDAAQLEGDADMHTLIATGVLSGSDDADGSSEAARGAPRSEGGECVGTPSLSCLVDCGGSTPQLTSGADAGWIWCMQTRRKQERTTRASRPKAAEGVRAGARLRKVQRLTC